MNYAFLPSLAAPSRLVYASAALIVVLTSLSHAASAAEEGEPGPPRAGDCPKDAQRFAFEGVVPGSRIRLDEELVEEANGKATCEEQVTLLIKVLTSTSGEDKTLTSRQIAAAWLLGLSRSRRSVDPLITRIDYRSKVDGHQPIPHVLSRIGEPAVAGLMALARKTDDQRLITQAAISLHEIKGKQFEAFLKSHKDDLPESAYETMAFVGSIREAVD